MDDKFEKLMKGLRKQEPDDLQMKKWKKSVRKEFHARAEVKPTSTIYWGQLVAAVFVGVVIGGLLFGRQNLGSAEFNNNISTDDATIEVIYTNL